MSEFKVQPKGFATKAIHVAQEPEQWTHQAVIPPLVMSTTFKQPSPAEPIVSVEINKNWNCAHSETAEVKFKKEK